MRPRPRVALLVETSNSYARELLYGVRGYIREHGPWSIYLAEHGRGDTVPGWLRTWKGDGVIARVENAGIARAIRKTGLPAVDVSAGLEAPVFPQVATDNRAVADLAAKHLLERGLKRFGYCGDDRFHWSRERKRFFWAAVAEAGCACEGFLPPHRNTPQSWEEEILEIGRWIERLTKPVGIMACYDIRGQQVLEACRRLGVEVPDQAAVIGVHNDGLLCDLCDPPLSSVIPNPRRAGHEAASLLDRMMGGEKVKPAVKRIEPLGVATRQSTDVVAVEDRKMAAAIRFIREHACEGIAVADVLRAVPMSRTSLERRLKQIVGRTPHEQILRVRVERVKALLAGTDLPLSVVAEQTGFKHPEYLSVAFKRVTGLSPGRYRAGQGGRG